MENKNNTNIWIGVVIGLVILTVALFFIFRSKSTVTTSFNAPATDNTTALEPSSTLDTSGSTTTTGGAQQISISYADALVKYADRRIQLDKSCQAFPNTVTYKDNTGIMIDNRSPEARTIKIGTTFTIKAWGFKIFVLPDVYLKSKTILVDCDSQQNVATVLVQE